MNILSISSILPIHDLLSHNDFVFQTYNNYRKIYKEDKIVIIKPIKYNLNILTALKGTSRLGKLKGKYQWQIQDFQVEIFPFFSSWGLRNLHSILTRSVYHINARRIKKLLADYRIDVIHAQYIFPDGMLAYILNKKFHLPYLVTTHHERYFFDRFLSRRMGIEILRNAYQVTPLNFTNGQYFRTLGLKNVELVPLGFDRRFLRKQKTIVNKKTSVFTVSVLIALKNIDKVIHAIALLVKSYDISYTIIGNGPEKENLVNLVEELGLTDAVHFIGHIPHESIADEMYRHDIFIMPSFFETFGRVYFECMAMGIPVICAKNSGIYGLFAEGEEGISVDHNNIYEIAEAIELLVNHPEERLKIGLKGQKLVSRYTWDQIAGDYHMRYENSIGKSE